MAEHAPKHVHSDGYRRLIQPLLTVPDFHVHYFEDGASDATVTCPNDCTFGAGEQIALTHFNTYNHSPIFTTRLRF